MMWVTKKQLKKQIAELEQDNIDLGNEVKCLTEVVDTYNKKFPFDFGETVYDVQLRGENGRYTKKNPSREHSVVNEVIVDKKNYFNLVDRYNQKDVFTELKLAEEYLDSICTK